MMVKLLKTQEIAGASYLYLREYSAPGITWGIIERDILDALAKAKGSFGANFFSGYICAM